MSPVVLPGFTVSMPNQRHSYVIFVRNFAFFEGSPTKYILLVSPYHPSSMTVISIFKISPSSRILSPGIP